MKVNHKEDWSQWQRGGRAVLSRRQRELGKGKGGFGGGMVEKKEEIGCFGSGVEEDERRGCFSNRGGMVEEEDEEMRKNRGK